MSPDAAVSIIRNHGGRCGGRKGHRELSGHSYSFKLVGGVTGGVGAANTQATGEVYDLHKISDFKGLYTQSSGGPGFVDVRRQRSFGCAMRPGWCFI